MSEVTHDTETHIEDTHDDHDENFSFVGRTFPVPVYTGVFVVLGILTLIEVTLSQLPHGFFTIPLMLILSIVKAGLVVWFYMHLNKDSRIFLACLLIPVVLVIVAITFLSLIPVGGYS